MNNLTSHEYWKEVGELAADILEELEVKTTDDY